MNKIKILTIFVMLLLINTNFIDGEFKMKASEPYEYNEQITALINGFNKEYNHEIQLITKEIEQRLYGKWRVEDTLGYSLKYQVTGGGLYKGKLDVSKDIFSFTTFSPVLKNIDGQMLTTGDFEEYTTVFRTPIFMYYQETLEQMKQDMFLDEYSGIKDIDPDTVGTIIIAVGLPVDSSDKYEFITTKFIIINDYTIAVRQSTFYKLEKIDS